MNINLYHFYFDLNLLFFVILYTVTYDSDKPIEILSSSTYFINFDSPSYDTIKS